MAKYYYKKRSRSFKKLVRLLSIPAVVLGACLIVYIFFPLLSWQIYFAPAFASQNIEVPIPKTSVVNQETIKGLLSLAANRIGSDYTNADNWYPNISYSDPKKKIISQYILSIPRIGIDNAQVSTVDRDLAKHLVQFNADSVPPNEGNTVIFGHSTLPQLYDEKNYKTIFANAYKIDIGDEIFVTVENVVYKYKVQSITVVEPENTSVLAQNFTDSFITLITCTPPGTIWKRLIIKAKLEKV